MVAAPSWQQQQRNHPGEASQLSALPSPAQPSARTAVKMRVGLAPVQPAQMPIGMQISMMLSRLEVSMCHTARASVRGDHVPALVVAWGGSKGAGGAARSGALHWWCPTVVSHPPAMLTNAYAAPTSHAWQQPASRPPPAHYPRHPRPPALPTWRLARWALCIFRSQQHTGAQPATRQNLHAARQSRTEWSHSARGGGVWHRQHGGWGKQWLRMPARPPAALRICSARLQAEAQAAADTQS